MCESVGRDHKVVTAAIELCGGDTEDSMLHNQVHAIWKTEILSEGKRKSGYGSDWTPLSSTSIQRTIIICGGNVTKNSALLPQLGEMLWDEIEHYRMALKRGR